HRMRAADFPDHARHDLARAVTSFDLGRIVDVDTAECVGEAVEVTFAPNFAVGDDVYARGFLHAHRLCRRIVLSFLNIMLLDPPDLFQSHARRCAGEHDLSG